MIWQAPLLEGVVAERALSTTYLREALLLQVGDNALAQQTRSTNEIQDFVIIVTDERKLESIFCGINSDGTRPSRAVQTVHDLAFDSSQVDWVVKGTNDPVVAAVVKVKRVSGTRDRKQTPEADSI
jgi:hypothetical protein